MSIKLNLSQHNFYIKNTNIASSPTVNKNISTKGMKSQSNTNLMGDKITISSQGLNMSKNTSGHNKINSAIENLMKQKESLLERKGDMVTNMLEKNMDISHINQMTKDIEEQLKDIDKQIAEIQFEEQRKSIGIDEESKKEKQSKKTDNSSNNADSDISNEDMRNLISASSDLQDIKVMSSFRSDIKGKMRVLEKEIELDKSRSIDGKATKNKYEEYDKLENNLSGLEEKIGNNISKLNEEQLNDVVQKDGINKDIKNDNEDKKDIDTENNQDNINS